MSKKKNDNNEQWHCWFYKELILMVIDDDDNDDVFFLSFFLFKWSHSHLYYQKRWILIYRLYKEQSWLFGMLTCGDDKMNGVGKEKQA